MGVDVGSDDETDDVEERHPGVFGEELLRKSKGQRRSDPADLHDGHETGAHGGANLVDSARTGDDTHRGEVNNVLDRGDLHRGIVSNAVPGANRMKEEDKDSRTIRLLTRICKILALRLVRPAKIFCRMATRK